MVTAALPFLVCGMSSVRTSAQVFPTLNSQKWRGRAGGGEGRRGRKREERREKRRKRKREHPANVDMTEALKSPIRQ